MKIHNPVAKELLTSRRFYNKIVKARKGKGSYSRKGKKWES